MRICFISWEFPEYTSYGGIAYYVNAIADLLARANNDVTVITANTNSTVDSFTVRDGINIYFLAAKTHDNFTLKIPKLLNSWKNSDNWVPFDIIETAEYLGDTRHVENINDYCKVKITRLHGTLIQYYFGNNNTLLLRLNWLFDLPSERMLYLLKRIFKHKLFLTLYVNNFERKETQRANYVTAPSKILTNFAIKCWYIKKIEIFPNPPTIRDINSESLLEKKYVGNEIILTFLGTISILKGFDLFLKFLEEVAIKNQENLKFIVNIAGTFNESEIVVNRWRRRLMKIAENQKIKIKLHGKLIHTEVKNLLDKTHFLFVLSLFDNFPNVHVEGMASGCLVFSSPGSGTNYLSAMVHEKLCFKTGDLISLIDSFNLFVNLPIKELLILHKRSLQVVNEHVYLKNHHDFYVCMMKDKMIE